MSEVGRLLHRTCNDPVQVKLYHLHSEQASNSIMAFYTLHYILFTTTKLANPYLMLEEFHRQIWKQERMPYGEELDRSPPSYQRHSFQANNIGPTDLNRIDQEPNQERLRTFYSSDLVLFISNLLTFLVAIKLVRDASNRGHCGRLLLQCLGWCCIFHIAYLYLINTLARNRSTDSSLTLKLLHTVAVMFQFFGVQCTCSCIQSLVDPIAMSQSQESVKFLEPHYQFVTYLTLGSLSLAFSSLSLYEVMTFIGNDLELTNSSLGISLIAILLEFGFTSCTSIMDEFVLIKPSSGTTKATSEQGQVENHTSIFSSYFRSDGSKLSSPILTISAANFTRSNRGEIVRVVDDDEFDTSNEIFYTRLARLQVNGDANYKSKSFVTDNEDIELYDRNKFSLYEGYDVKEEKPKLAYSTPKIENRARLRINPILTSYSHIREDQCHCVKLNGSDTSLLKKGANILKFALLSRPFLIDALLLTIIGSIYQANQLFILVEYLYFLINNSPNSFKTNLLSMTKTWSINDVLSTNTSRNIHIKMMSVYLVVQCLARTITLHYIASIVQERGRRKVLVILLLLAITVPLQYSANCNFVQSWQHRQQAHDSPTTIGLVLILSQIILIQLVIGMIGAGADFLINDLTLLYARQFRDEQLQDSKQSGEVSTESDYSTLHAVLNGLFYNFGASVSIAIHSYVEMCVSTTVDNSIIFAHFQTLNDKSSGLLVTTL